jgi:hypothetical protein
MYIENNMKESSSSSSLAPASPTINADADVNAVIDASHHALSTGWTLWCHLPHDTDWSLKSYINSTQWNKRSV